MTNLTEKLLKEITSLNQIEPKVTMFVDESAIFWVTNDSEFVWMQNHSGIDEFVDNDHAMEDRRYTDKSTEGVGNIGVYWNNSDFSSPYHISDYNNRIAQINC